MKYHKIVVIDDDPTGSQLVHSCPLLLTWDVPTLRHFLRHQSPLLFILANTRSLDPVSAAHRNHEIIASLERALVLECLQRNQIQLVSRGDSTLRGHGFLEPQVLANSFGPYDATFHVPAFLEGGRTTVNGVHLLHGEPVHKTPFAQDRLFGFKSSYLPDWLEEKSNGSISSKSVECITTSELTLVGSGSIHKLAQRLRSFHGNISVVVDAQQYKHLHVFSSALSYLTSEKRFLFRSSASLLKVFANLSPSSLAPSSLVGLRRQVSGRLLPGLIVVGSHVPLADSQLDKLFSQPQCVPVELPVREIARAFELSWPISFLDDLERSLLSKLKNYLTSGNTPVFYTSRGEVTFGNDFLSRRFSAFLAGLMARLTSSVTTELGYLICKGGLTTQTLLSDGLALSSVQLEGQLLPGLSVVRPTDGPVHGLPIVTFPGNLGSSDTLLHAWELLEARRSC